MAPWLRVVSFVFAFLLLVTLVPAPGIDNPYLPIQKPVSIENSSLFVNNSVYWNNRPWSDIRWLNIDGANANQDIDIGTYDFRAENILGDGTGSYFNKTLLIDGDMAEMDATLVVRSHNNLYACINLTEGGNLGFSICNDGSGSNRLVFANLHDGYEWMWIDRDDGTINFLNDTVFSNIVVDDIEANGDLDMTGHDIINVGAINATIGNFTTLYGGTATFDYIDPIDYIQFNESFLGTPAEGRLQWNTEDGTLEVGMPGGEVTLQIGQEMLILATNHQGVDVANGVPVIITGSTGNNIEFGLVNNTISELARKTIGIVTENISNHQRGYITTVGFVRDFDTSSWSEGDFLFVGENDGELTNVKPIAPLNKIRVGVVTRSHATEGAIYVSIDKSIPLYELSNVNVSNATQGSILIYDEATKVWRSNIDINIGDGEIRGGFIDRYDAGNFTGSLYSSGANSSLSDSNSLFAIISDTRGTPQFMIQDGGPSQASFITRSFMVVNQNNTLLNSSQNNVCSDWGFIHIDCNTSTTGADFGVTDDIEALGVIYSDEGLRSHSSEHGSYLVLGDRNMLYAGSHGDYDYSENVFCDYTANNFIDSGGSQWIVIKEETSPYDDARADVKVFINSSCIELEHNPSWDANFDSNTSWVMTGGIGMVVQSGGFFEYYIGDNVQSGFKIKANNATSPNSFILDTTAGVDDQTSMSIYTDSMDKNAVNSLEIFMSSSTGVDGVTSNTIKLLGDATGFNNSFLHFINIALLGMPGPGNDIDVININGDVDHIIHAGASVGLSKMYIENSTGIFDITDIESLVFQEDDSVLYIGSTLNFTSIGVSLSSGSSTDITAIYYYCNSEGTYTSVTGVTDSTSGFQSSGSIIAGNPLDRGLCNQAIDGTPFANTTNYTYIGIQRTKNHVNSPPVLSSVALAGGSSQFLLAADYMKLSPVDEAPKLCDATMLGAIYYDISEDNMCACKSTGWKVIEDGTDCT